MSSKEFLWAKGADVASATSIALGTDGNVFDITGTTNIETITAKQAGSVALLQFDGSLSLVDDTGNLELNGSNISCSAETRVILVCDGTNWQVYSVYPEGTTTNPLALDVVTAETTVCTSSTAEETLYTYTVPANTMSTNNLLRLRAVATVTNNSGGAISMTIKVKYGSTTVDTITDASLATNATAGQYLFDLYFKGDGTTSSQELSGLIHYSQPGSNGTISANQELAHTTGTAAEDSTGALALAITCQSNTSDGNISVILKNASIEKMTAL